MLLCLPRTDSSWYKQSQLVLLTVASMPKTKTCRRFRWHRRARKRAFVLVGDEDWPFPVPLVNKDGKWWSFDRKAGRQELLYRRIGANELDAVEIFHGYVEAQHDYAYQKRKGWGFCSGCQIEVFLRDRRRICMKKLIALVVVLVVGAIVTAAQDVRYNFAQDVDFSKFKTYKWVEVKGTDHANQLTEKQIKDAIDTALAGKGLQKTDSDTADLYIDIQTAVGTEKQFNSYNTGWGYGPGWGGGWYGYGGGMTSSTTYGSTSTIYVGQLGLDMYDSAKKDLVWRGVASKTIDPKAKAEKQQKNITKAVTKLLKNYPPKKK